MKVFILPFIFCFLNLTGLALLCQDTPDKTPDNTPAKIEQKQNHEEFHTWTKSIFELMTKLESSDQQEQSAAMQQLIRLGPSAIPFLVEKLKTKGIYIELTRQILLRQHDFTDELKITSKILKDLMLSSSAKELSLIQKYYYSKYVHATQLYHMEKYQEAKEIVEAILLLEPHLNFKDSLKGFRILCEEKMIQQKMIKTTLEADNEIYEIGSNVKLTLTMENLTLTPIEITFGPNNFIILHLTMAEYDPWGNSSFISRMEEVKIPSHVGDKIELKPQAQWEIPFSLDTSRDNPHSIYYRVYTVQAEIRPLKLKGTQLETRRKITTPLLRLKAFPPKIDPVLKAPLASLGKALDGGIPIDIFLCALLVPKKDHEKEIEMLMTAMEKSIADSSDETKKVIINCLKHITELPLEIDAKVWLDWWRTRKKVD